MVLTVLNDITTLPYRGGRGGAKRKKQKDGASSRRNGKSGLRLERETEKLIRKKVTKKELIKEKLRNFFLSNDFVRAHMDSTVAC